MPSADILLAFLGISILITLAPGPDNLMVLSLSIARGRGPGLAFATGCALGCLTHTLWATLGISALLHTEPALFTALKIAGALYLLWLGIQALRSSPTAAPRDADMKAIPAQVYLRRGFIANAINPKVALFFLAFLRQFSPNGAPLEIVTLGALFALQTTLAFGLIALSSARLGGLLRQHPRTAPWLDRLAGMAFIGLAIHLVLQQDTPGTTTHREVMP